MTRPDPHVSYREHVSSEAEAVEERETMIEPIGLAGMAALEAEMRDRLAAKTLEIEVLRSQLAAARNALEEARGAMRFVLAFYEPGQRYLDTEAWKSAEAGMRHALINADALAALNSGEQKQIEDWPYPEGNPTCAQDLK